MFGGGTTADPFDVPWCSVLSWLLCAPAPQTRVERSAHLRSARHEEGLTQWRTPGLPDHIQDVKPAYRKARLLGDGKAFVECILAFLLALGFQLAHKATCRGGGCLTRHSHYARVRLGGLTIWRVQCTTCKAVIGIESCFQ